jgi:hypothetical protein
LSRLRSPERTDEFETRRRRSPDRLNDNRRIKSPQRSEGERITRFDSPKNSQGINRLLSSEGARLDRIRSPERLNEVGIDRTHSRERSTEQSVDKVEYRERANDERISKRAPSGRSEAQRNVRDERALREKARDSKEFPSSYPVGHEILNKRNSGNDYKVDFNSNQKKITSPNGIQNDKNFENRTRGIRDPSSLGQRNNVVNREGVERPKPVTVTVMSLSEGPVYVKSPVIGRVRSNDGSDVMYECNGIVSADAGWQGGARNKKSTLGKLQLT